MRAIPERITGSCRMWLETPAPPREDTTRVVRLCPECPTWCIGADDLEAAGRLAEHRRVCHS